METQSILKTLREKKGLTHSGSALLGYSVP